MAEAGADPVLGVLMAGGQNRRYGGRPKALIEIEGDRIADRVVRGLRAATDRVVVIANDPDTYRELGLPIRGDIEPGLGALGGIYTAVRWAEETGCRGALVVACDMPFVPPGLLRRIVTGARTDEVVLPESESRRGMEPLCGFYGRGCRPAIEDALKRGDRAIVSFLDGVALRTIPRDEVAGFDDPARIFLNVNTPEDRERAEALARGGGTAS